VSTGLVNSVEKIGLPIVEIAVGASRPDEPFHSVDGDIVVGPEDPGVLAEALLRKSAPNVPKSRPLFSNFGSKIAAFLIDVQFLQLASATGGRCVRGNSSSSSANVLL